MLRVTAELGGRFCRVLSGQNRPGLDAAHALQWVIDALHELLPHAERAGRDDVSRESLQRRTVAVPGVRAVSRPLPRDPRRGELAVSRRAVRSLERSRGRRRSVRSCSIAYCRAWRRCTRLTGTSRVAPSRISASTIAIASLGYASVLAHGVIGRGLNDYDRIFSTLAAGGFNGWISIEDGEGPTVEIGMAQSPRERERFSATGSRRTGAAADRVSGCGFQSRRRVVTAGSLAISPR